MGGPEFFSVIQFSITNLLIRYEPAFVAFGSNVFTSLAIIMISWHGIQMMFSTEDTRDKMFGFVKLLMFISFGLAMSRFYNTPIPGIGISFIHLITDQTQYFANVLDAGSMSNVYNHLNTVQNSFIAPGTALDFMGGILYYGIVFLLMFGKVLSVAIVGFALIAQAVCVLLGPIFVPFFIAPKQLDWFFWGWFKSLLQYSFMPVVAYAYLMIMEQFIYNVMTTLPPGITSDLYLTYGVQVMIMVGVLVVGMLFIPSLTNSIFSGHSHGGMIITRLMPFRK